MKNSKLIGSFWLACGFIGVALLAAIPSTSVSTSQVGAQQTAPPPAAAEAHQGEDASTPSPTKSPEPAPSSDPSAGKPQPQGTPSPSPSESPKPQPQNAAPPSAAEAASTPTPGAQSTSDAEGKVGSTPALVPHMIPTNAVFGCDSPGAGLADPNGNGGTANNALIVTQTPPPGSGVYGPQQGDLIVFTESPNGESGAFRCGRTARYLNYFVSNPSEFQGFVFRVDQSPSPMLCYAPGGAPCEDSRARLVTLLEKGKTPTLEALQRFTTNLNLMRNVAGSPPVHD